jgi:hypothetical protein
MPPDLIYDVPLSPEGRFARLCLPTDLTSADAERIARFVESLVLPRSGASASKPQ